MLGLSAVLGVDSIEHQAITFTGCDVLAIDPSALRRAAEVYPEIDRALLRYANLRLVQAMKLAACHLRHQLEQRLAAWTEAMSDLLGSSEIAVTHQQLSAFMGVTRPSVTVGLQVLEGRGAIWSRRGVVMVRNRAVLEGLSCGCYQHAALDGRSQHKTPEIAGGHDTAAVQKAED
jgi:CRP-like cAMP-binding protein